MAGVISAATARERKKKEGRMRAGAFAMSQLANAATSFLHNFGGAIGNVQSRLDELRGHLAPVGVPPIREKQIPVADFIEGMIDSLAQAAEAIGDLKKRFDPEGAEYQFRDVNLATVAEDVVERSRRRHADSGIDFQFDDQLRVLRRDGKAPVYSRAICRLTDKVYEVLENLTENAVRAIKERPQGSLDARVTITVRLNEALDALLRVTDNGIGIPEVDQPRIFDYDYSTRKDEGVTHGMGLFLCQMYAFQFGGELNFQSQPGKGSWFEIAFPTVEA
jgi:signal transduction histidine kinase